MSHVCVPMACRSRACRRNGQELMRVDVPPARRRSNARPARCTRTGSLPPETGHSQAPLAATVAVEAGYPACGLGACRAAHLWHAPAEPPGTSRLAGQGVFKGPRGGIFQSVTATGIDYIRPNGVHLLSLSCAKQKSKPTVGIALVSFATILIGYSTFFILVGLYLLTPKYLSKFTSCF